MENPSGKSPRRGSTPMEWYIRDLMRQAAKPARRRRGSARNGRLAGGPASASDELATPSDPEPQDTPRI